MDEEFLPFQDPPWWMCFAIYPSAPLHLISHLATTTNLSFSPEKMEKCSSVDCYHEAAMPRWTNMFISISLSFPFLPAHFHHFSLWLIGFFKKTTSRKICQNETTFSRRALQGQIDLYKIDPNSVWTTQGEKSTVSIDSQTKCMCAAWFSPSVWGWVPICISHQPLVPCNLKSEGKNIFQLSFLSPMC